MRFYKNAVIYSLAYRKSEQNRRLKDQWKKEVKDGWQSGAIAAVLRTSQQGEPREAERERVVSSTVRCVQRTKP